MAKTNKRQISYRNQCLHGLILQSHSSRLGKTDQWTCGNLKREVWWWFVLNVTFKRVKIKLNMLPVGQTMFWNRCVPKYRYYDISRYFVLRYVIDTLAYILIGRTALSLFKQVYNQITFKKWFKQLRNPHISIFNDSCSQYAIHSLFYLAVVHVKLTDNV